MRFFVTFTLALLLVGSAAAQEASAAPATGDVKSWTIMPAPNRLNATGADWHPQFDRQFMVSPGTRQSTCWFIRSYVFERRDGEAPVFKRETTCTPAYRNPLRQTRKHGAKLVPLGW